MLGLIRFRYRLRRLERQLADVHKTYQKQRVAAKARGASEEELEALSAANSTDDLYFTEALLAAHTSRLIKNGSRSNDPSSVFVGDRTQR